MISGKTSALPWNPGSIKEPEYDNWTAFVEKQREIAP